MTVTVNIVPKVYGARVVPQPVSLRAYICEREDANGTYWTFTSCRDDILRAQKKNRAILFKATDVNGRPKPEEVRRRFLQRYPPDDPAMERIHFDPRYDRVTVKKESVYKGDDPATAARLAQKFDGVLDVTQGNVSCWRTTAFDWDQQRHVPKGEARLWEHGCYLREVERPVERGHAYFYEIVYNPEVAARRKKKWSTAPKKKERKDRELPYITLSYFQIWGNAMRDHVGMSGVGYLADEYIEVKSRYMCLKAVTRILNTFTLLYGPGAYRRVKGFAAIAKQWEQKGKATWDAFDAANNYNNPRSHATVFQLFDKEVKEGRKRWPRVKEPKDLKVTAAANRALNSLNS